MTNLIQAVKRSLPSPLLWFLGSSLLLNGVAVCVWACAKYVLHETDYPHSYYTLPGEAFFDVTGFIQRFRAFHTNQFFNGTLGGPYLYPPGVAPFYEVLYLAGRPLVAFFGMLAVLVLSFALWLMKRLRESRIGWFPSTTFVVLTVACSYVLLFEAERANVEIFLTALCVTGVLLLRKERPASAAACFGIAGAMKIYPLIYLGLLISRREYKQFAIGLGVCAAFTVASLWLICPDLRISVSGVHSGLHTFGGMYSLSLMPIQGSVDHSAFYVIKRVLSAQPHAMLQHALAVYMLACSAGLLVLYFKRIRYLPLVNQAVCFTAAATIVPPTSFEYTLLQFYAPWTLLVLITVKSDWQRLYPKNTLTIVFILFALVFSNLGEIVIHGNRVEGMLKAAVIFALFIVALLFPLSCQHNQSLEAAI